MTNLTTFITAAWTLYSADPRLDAPPFPESLQRAPDDLGAFQSALIATTPLSVPTLQWQQAAYRHYRNAVDRGHKAPQEGFAEGIRLAYIEAGGVEVEQPEPE